MTMSVLVNNTSKSINAAIFCLTLGLEGTWKSLFAVCSSLKISANIPTEGSCQPHPWELADLGYESWRWSARSLSSPLILYWQKHRIRFMRLTQVPLICLSHHFLPLLENGWEERWLWGQLSKTGNSWVPITHSLLGMVLGEEERSQETGSLGSCHSTISSHDDVTSNTLSSCRFLPQKCLWSALSPDLTVWHLPYDLDHQTSTSSVQPSCLYITLCSGCPPLCCLNETPVNLRGCVLPLTSTSTAI